jgi:hypothetical protein
MIPPTDENGNSLARYPLRMYQRLQEFKTADECEQVLNQAVRYCRDTHRACYDANLLCVWSGDPRISQGDNSQVPGM